MTSIRTLGTLSLDWRLYHDKAGSGEFQKDNVGEEWEKLRMDRRLDVRFRLQWKRRAVSTRGRDVYRNDVERLLKTVHPARYDILSRERTFVIMPTSAAELPPTDTGPDPKNAVMPVGDFFNRKRIFALSAYRLRSLV